MKTFNKIGIIALISILSFSLCACSPISELSHATTGAEETMVEVEKVYPNLMSSKTNDGEMVKEETVYVIEDADGEITKIIANEWLKNGEGQESIEDVSNLSEIKNLTGDEEFKEADGNIIWEAEGNDIKYQGELNEDLPVNINVTYYLNGKKMKAQEMEGKAGKVEIHFTYDLNKRDTVYADGEKITVLHPYTMASGLMLSNEHFSNITVNNGKAVDDGSNSICVGIAFPGLNDNLNIDENVISIPDDVVITAYTDDFRIDGTFTIAMSGLLNEVGNLDYNVSDLTEGLIELSEASEELLDGTDELNTSTNDLLTGTEQLETGAAELNLGLKTLDENGETLKEGTSKLESFIFETATNEFREQLIIGGMSEEDANAITLTPENYLMVISSISGMTPSEQQVEDAEKLMRAMLDEKGLTDESLQTVVISFADDIINNKEAATTESALTMAATYAKEAQLVGSIEDGDNIMVNVAKILCSMNSDSTENYANYTETATKYCQDTVRFTEASKTPSSAKVEEIATLAVYEKLAASASSLRDLKTELDSVEEYVAGVKAYTKGVSDAYVGSETLSLGMTELKRGVTLLNEGAKKLDEGMNEFNEEGIEKMVKNLDEADIDGIIKRFHAVSKSSGINVMLGGKSEGMSGESKLIFKTEAIGE